MAQISNKEWTGYQKLWMHQLQKHLYDGTYALNLMDSTYDQLKNLPLSTFEFVCASQKFHNIWNQLMTLVKNSAINKGAIL